MSSQLSAELVATCNALGYYDEKQNKYFADLYTLDSVKDLIRYLRRDTQKHDIRRQLGKTKVVSTDLLPLLKSYWEETDLFDVLLRLIVNLTTPALVLYNEEMPTDRAVRNEYLQIEEHLREYKQAFADEAIWAVLSSRISKILELDSGERGDDNGLIIERILILIRNVLYVPADPDAEKRPDNDASVHDQVLWSLHQSGMLDIILYITSSETEQAYYMHVLEILSFMLREQSASELANAALQRSVTEKLRDEAELVALRQKEKIQEQQRMKYRGSRHFSGTYVVKSMKGIGENHLISHKPLDKIEALNFDANKTNHKTRKNHLAVKVASSERRSAFSIRLFLKEFCVELLNGAYNTFMHHVKSRLSRAKAQQNDESYYLWAMRFFMEFNRNYKFEVKLVSETMSIHSFHFVQQQMENYFDMIATDRKKCVLWSRRLHLALLAYRELLLTIATMDKSADAGVRDSAKVIKSNIFYVLEYRELIITLLVTFDEVVMSQLYLRDLIETQHIFLKMLEAYCGGRAGRVMVQGHNKLRRKKPTKSAHQEQQPAALDLPAMWDETAPQLTVVLETNRELTADVVPFDAGSDTPIDEQKAQAMKNIQKKLRDHDFEIGVGLLRAAREVWPENDCFGSAHMATEEEFLALRDIFFADLGDNEVAPVAPPEPEEEDDYEEDEEDDQEAEMNSADRELNFQDVSRRLAHPRVVRACALALDNFEENSVLANHCIAKLLHRIAVECNMSTMLFQVKLFRTFQKIFGMKSLPQYKELTKFAIFIIRQFFKLAETNSSVFMEALFWKSSKDACDIEEGYGSYNEKSSAAMKGWTEQQEDELRILFTEHQQKRIEEDVVDWIVNNLIDNTRSRRGVLKKLKQMYLLTDYKGARSKSGVKTRVPKQWGEDEEAQLGELYEQFKDAMDPLTCIMDRLDVHRPKNRIVEKLLVMGVVQDRKELRKKRVGKSQKAGHGPVADSDNDSVRSSDSDADEARAVAPSIAAKKKTKKTSGGRKAPVRKSAAALTAILLRIKDEGMEDALEWLKESLSDVAEDMVNEPDDSDEGVPLVPILDQAVSAMEHVGFLDLLKSMGVQQPQDEQESYWRIPATLTANELNGYCALLAQALDGTLAEVESEPIIAAPGDESSDDEDVFEKLKKARAKKNEATSSSTKDEEPASSNEVTSSSANENQNLSKSTSVARKKRFRIDDSSDEDEEANNSIVEAESSNATISFSVNENKGLSNSAKKKRIQIDDSSDEEEGEAKAVQEEDNTAVKSNKKRFQNAESSDEDDGIVRGSENVNKVNVNVDEDVSKRIRSTSDSDGEQPRSKKARIIDSDED